MHPLFSTQLKIFSAGIPDHPSTRGSTERDLHHPHASHTELLGSCNRSENSEMSNWGRYAICQATQTCTHKTLGNCAHRGSSSFHLHFECDTERAMLAREYGDYEAICREEKLISTKGEIVEKKWKHKYNMSRDKPLTMHTIYQPPIHPDNTPCWYYHTVPTENVA